MQEAAFAPVLPALFISHGSPMLALEHHALHEAFARLRNNLPEPRGIVVMSAHWESAQLEVSVASQPETWHDFRGFPDALYRLRYPAPGHPGLARQVLDVLARAGIEAHENQLRPRDHGAWMPLMLIYPQADIPVVQVSLPRTATPAQLMGMGAALADLRAERVLLVGSGSITHNLAELDWTGESATTPPWARDFRNWMVHALAVNDTKALQNWKTLAPHAERNHPTDEHLRPLFFACGAGKRFAVVHSSFEMGALGMDLYRFD